MTKLNMDEYSSMASDYADGQKEKVRKNILGGMITSAGGALGYVGLTALGVSGVAVTAPAFAVAAGVAVGGATWAAISKLRDKDYRSFRAEFANKFIKNNLFSKLTSDEGTENKVEIDRRSKRKM